MSERLGMRHISLNTSHMYYKFQCVPARMLVQNEGGNKTRAIKFTTSMLVYNLCYVL